VGVVESIDRGMFLALLFTALGEVVVGVEVLRAADPEYVRLGVAFSLSSRRCPFCGA
jgi:hypothetical protein